MKKNLKLNAIFAAALACVGSSSVFAQSTDVDSRNVGITIRANNDGVNNSEILSLQAGNGGGSGNSSSVLNLYSSGQVGLQGVSSIDIVGNADNSSGTEGVFIRSNATDPAAYLYVGSDGLANLGSTSQTSINSPLLILNGTTTNLTGTTTNVGGTTTNLNSTTTNVTGETNINTTGAAPTTIGNAASVVTLNGGTNNIGTTTATTANNIGHAASTNTVIGTTLINNNVNAATSINTGTSTGVVTVGNQLNTTNLNSATNNIGVNAYATTNNIGTGTAANTNNVGNSNAATQVNARAGSAQMQLSDGSAKMYVPSGASGVNNGVEVTTTQTATTGGNTSPTRMTLNDNAATFSRVSNGAPITVTGVADGRQDFDAVNVRQFAGAVAAVAAQANIPPLAAGQDASIGIGVGSYMGKSGFAMGMNVRSDKNNATYRMSVATGLNEGGSKPIAAVGVAWGF